jgi:RHS repeat-associated protein
MPDAVGNLFRTSEKSDRKYGPAGQLLEVTTPGGVTKYEYDPEGNLVKKLLPDGSEWKYQWNGAGMLAKVERPDGGMVEFGYDALGRRVWKKYEAKMTRWMWDGNVPVHEWVEVDPTLEAPPDQQEAVEADSSLTARKFMLTKRFAQGPPPEEAGTAAAPITWVFEPESFAPLGKLSATARYGIVTDHLGTPTAMLDEAGQLVWSADIGVYGELQNVVGEKGACPFRWPGQYEDEETGLYYNHFRYYDPEAGGYLSPDPIGLRGGLRGFGYVRDPLMWIDSLGLTCAKNKEGELITFRGDSREPSEIFKTGFRPRGTNDDLQTYVLRSSASAFVSTSKSAQIARERFASDGEYVYTIRPREGAVDVNAALGDKHVFAYEQEVAVKGGIPPQDIVGARRVGPDGKFDGPFIRNPQYVE